MLKFLIAVYRANPFRPHCNSQAGVHAWTCRLFGMTHACDAKVPRVPMPGD